MSAPDQDGILWSSTKRAAWYCFGYAKQFPESSFEEAYRCWIEYEEDDYCSTEAPDGD